MRLRKALSVAAVGLGVVATSLGLSATPAHAVYGQTSWFGCKDVNGAIKGSVRYYTNTNQSGAKKIHSVEWNYFSTSLSYIEVATMNGAGTAWIFGDGVAGTRGEFNTSPLPYLNQPRRVLTKVTLVSGATCRVDWRDY
jgi:hypothetical protein